MSKTKQGIRNLGYTKRKAIVEKECSHSWEDSSVSEMKKCANCGEICNTRFIGTDFESEEQNEI